MAHRYYSKSKQFTRVIFCNSAQIRLLPNRGSHSLSQVKIIEYQVRHRSQVRGGRNIQPTAFQVVACCRSGIPQQRRWQVCTSVVSALKYPYHAAILPECLVMFHIFEHLPDVSGDMRHFRMSINTSRGYVTLTKDSFALHWVTIETKDENGLSYYMKGLSSSQPAFEPQSSQFPNNPRRLGNFEQFSIISLYI
jgi:hypothetical protein